MAGTALVEAAAPGFARSGPKEFILPPGGEVDVKLVLKEAKSISGVVTNEDGQPMPGAKVKVGRELSEWKMNSVTADENGKFTVDGLDDGRYWVAASFPGYAGGNQMNVQPPTENVKVVVWRKGGLKGTVRDASGAPIRDFFVKVVTFRAREAAPVEDGTVTRFSSATGAFEMAELPPGVYRLVVSAEGFADAAWGVDVPPGGWAEVSATLSKSEVTQ
jgi:hypothetical protein